MAEPTTSVIEYPLWLHPHTIPSCGGVYRLRNLFVVRCTYVWPKRNQRSRLNQDHGCGPDTCRSPAPKPFLNATTVSPRPFFSLRLSQCCAVVLLLPNA